MTKHEFINEYGEKDRIAICNICKLEMLAHAKRNGTTGIRNHLEKCEGSGLYKYNDSSQTMLTQESFGASLLSQKFDQQRHEKKVVEWVIRAEQSFRAVEHPAFVALLKDLKPRFIVPSRKKVTTGVWELFLI